MEEVTVEEIFTSSSLNDDGSEQLTEEQQLLVVESFGDHSQRDKDLSFGKKSAAILDMKHSAHKHNKKSEGNIKSSSKVCTAMTSH